MGAYLLNGCLVAVSVVCAYHAPKRVRSATVLLAAVFAANWLDYTLSETAYPPAAIFWSIGWKLHGEELWKLADAVTALAALIAGKRYRDWRLLLIYELSLTQLVLHAAHWEVPLLSDANYYSALDKVFWTQIAVFVAMGGPGIVSRIHSVFGVRGMGNRLSAYPQPQVAP